MSRDMDYDDGHHRYALRDACELDRAGGYYWRHVSAMTSESLHAKSAIAGELGYRDMVIDQLRARVAELEAERDDALNLSLKRFKRIAVLEAENQRLRCALRDMVDLVDADANVHSDLTQRTETQRARRMGLNSEGEGT